MSRAFDIHDTGLGGPGIWDQMPLVPPTRTPKEVDDSKLIWSKPKLASSANSSPAKSKKKPTPKKAAKKRTAKKKPVKKRAKTKVRKKTAGRRKKRR